MPRNNHARRPGRRRNRGELRERNERIVARRRRQLRRDFSRYGNYQPYFHRDVRYPNRPIAPDVTPAGNVRRVTLDDYLAVDRDRLRHDRGLRAIVGLEMWRFVRQMDRRRPGENRHRCRCSWCVRIHEPHRGAARHRWRQAVARELADMGDDMAHADRPRP